MKDKDLAGNVYVPTITTSTKAELDSLVIYNEKTGEKIAGYGYLCGDSELDKDSEFDCTVEFKDGKFILTLP